MSAPTTPPPMPPIPNGDLTVSARDNFATCVALMVLTAIAVAARFGTRISLKLGISAHDWLCLLSLIFFYGYCIVIINRMSALACYRA